MKEATIVLRYVLACVRSVTLNILHAQCSQSEGSHDGEFASYPHSQLPNLNHRLLANIL